MVSVYIPDRMEVCVCVCLPLPGDSIQDLLFVRLALSSQL